MGTPFLEEAEALKASIDEALPASLRDRLLKSELTLTLGSSTAGPPHVGATKPAARTQREVVVIDADELAERELAGHRVSLRKDISGVDNTIFVSTKGYGRHAPRITIAIDPPNSFNETCASASMAMHDFSITGAYVPPRSWSRPRRSSNATGRPARLLERRVRYRRVVQASAAVAVRPDSACRDCASPRLPSTVTSHPRAANAPVPPASGLPLRPSWR